MRAFNEIFQDKSLDINKHPKLALLYGFSEGIFTDPFDHVDGIDALVFHSILNLGRGETFGGAENLERKLLEKYRKAYIDVYLPLFTYYAQSLHSVYEANDMTGDVVFFLRDAGKMLDVAKKRFEGTKFEDKLKGEYLTRWITQGNFSADPNKHFSQESLELSAKYQTGVLTDASIMADTGLYGIQQLSYYTGSGSLHFNNGSYWGGETNIQNIPISLKEGLLKGKKVYPFFIVSATHDENGYLIPGVMNHMMIKYRKVISDYYQTKIGPLSANQIKNLPKMIQSLFLDSIERIIPNEVSWQISLNEDASVSVLENNHPVARKVLNLFDELREQEKVKIKESDQRVIEQNALQGIFSLINLSSEAFFTRQFTGILPVGVPGKYIGSPKVPDTSLPYGIRGTANYQTSKEAYMQFAHDLGIGNSMIDIPNVLIPEVPYPEAEVNAAKDLFSHLILPA